MSSNAILQHNSARPKTANSTLETIRDLKLELLEHPPYCLKLVPSDFYMFGPLDDAIKRVHASNDEVKNAVLSWSLTQQIYVIFSSVITRSVEL